MIGCEFKNSVLDALIVYSNRVLTMCDKINFRQGKWVGLWLIIGLMVPVVQAEPDSCKPSAGNIPRAMFTTNIVEREPVDRVLIIENDRPQLHFFSDLRHFQGQTVSHRWEYDGQVVMTKSFEVKGPRWRVFSTRTLESDQLGRWTVVITDQDDCPLKAVVFRYAAKNTGNEATAIIDLK